MLVISMADNHSTAAGEETLRSDIVSRKMVVPFEKLHKNIDAVAERDDVFPL